MKTINDISNTLLNTSNLITKDIHDYFTDNTFNFTESTSARRSFQTRPSHPQISSPAKFAG